MQLFPAIYTKTPTRMSGLRGYVTASFGRALEWHSRGQRFDPAYLHQKGRRNGLFSQENKPFPLKKFRPFFLRGGIEPMMTDVRLFLQAHEWNPH